VNSRSRGYTEENIMDITTPSNIGQIKNLNTPTRTLHYLQAVLFIKICTFFMNILYNTPANHP
jgi:hypothetical protein